MLIDRFDSRPTFLGLTAYVFVVTIVTGCKPPSNTSSPGRLALEGALIVFIGPSANDPQWPGIVGGARRYLNDFPILKVEYRNPTDDRPESRAAVVEAVLAENPRLVVLYGRDPEILASTARLVMDAHVQLVTAGARTDVPGIFGHVEEDLPGAAELLGNHLDKIAGEKKSYLLLSDEERGARGVYIHERFVDKARDFKGLTMLAEQKTQAAESSRELIAEMLTRFPHAGFVVALASVLESPDLLVALREREAGYVALGAAPVLWSDLRSGKALALAGVNDGEIGAAAAELAVAALTEGRDPGAFKLVESELVTRETLPNFMQRYATATGLDLRKEMDEPGFATPTTQKADQP